MILEQIKTNPESIHFSDVIEFIDELYDFAPTAFKNGNTFNVENQNNGSCKIFSFAKLKQLSKEETLALFGDFYRKDVLENPEGEDHQNIRNFMEFGWDRIEFLKDALKEKLI
jgi:DNA-binding IscR family transcriptional regulator